MRVQWRSAAGTISNVEIDNIPDLDALLTDRSTEKISFDLLDARLVLRPDGTYQIFGGLINYPRI